jgi:hypothetical protein
VRQVKGILFVDYVRMLRGFKGIDWAARLPPEDVAYLSAQIDDDGWYPMATFERLGNQILHFVAKDDLQAVRMWGRFSVDVLRSKYPLLLAQGDPIETVNRFRVLRASFFDFDALEILMLHDDEAEIVIRYHMGMPAEEAAALQTLGFFERLLELAGGRDVQATLREKSWLGDSRTLLALGWQT